MIALELHKLFKRRLVWVVFLGIIVLLVISELYYESHYCDGNHYAKLQEKIAVFEKHKGTLTDERIEAFLGEYAMDQYDYIKEMFFDDSGERLAVSSVFQKVYYPVQFGYFEGWSYFLDQLPKYIKYIPIFIAVAFSSLFTYERECGMQEILLCARRGRGQCARAKVAGAFLLTNALCIFALVLPSIAA